MDPEKERERLSKIYSTKTDEELQQVDTESGELTDIAQEALREELARRRLPQNFERPDVAGEDELEVSRFGYNSRILGIARGPTCKGVTRLSWNRVVSIRRQYGADGLVQCERPGRRQVAS